VATQNKSKRKFQKIPRKNPTKLPKNSEITARNRRKERSTNSREKQVIINTKTTLNSQQFLTFNFTINCQQNNGPAGRRIAYFPRARSHFGGKDLRSLWQLE
jgi:hypothetical protein